MTLVARPTTYNGIKMRSRLEARFAAFLDRAEFDWVYEPRAFASKRGQYLPDFLIRNSGTIWDPLYVEIKGDAGPRLDVHLDKLRIIHESEPEASLALIEQAWMERPRTRGVPRYSYWIINPDLVEKTAREESLGGIGICGCGSVSFFPYSSWPTRNFPFFVCRRDEFHDGPVAYIDPFRQM